MAILRILINVMSLMCTVNIRRPRGQFNMRPDAMRPRPKNEAEAEAEWFGLKALTTLLLEKLLSLLLHPFNGLLSSTTWVRRCEKGKTSLDLNEARDDGVLGWLWHQLDHMQTICTSLQTDNHTNTSSLSFLQAGCSSWCPTNSVKALKAVTVMK